MRIVRSYRELAIWVVVLSLVAVWTLAILIEYGIWVL